MATLHVVFPGLASAFSNRYPTIILYRVDATPIESLPNGTTTVTFRGEDPNIRRIKVKFERDLYQVTYSPD